MARGSWTSEWYEAQHPAGKKYYWLTGRFVNLEPERLYGEMEIASRVTRPHGVSVGAGTAFFSSRSEMEQVLCDQGAAMLLGIEAAVGEEAFLQALRAYVERYAGRTGTLDALCTALLEKTGGDWRGYLEDELAF